MHRDHFPIRNFIAKTPPPADRNMAKKRNEEYSDDEYPDEPNFDDPEGFVDDVTDEGMCMVNVPQCQHGRALDDIGVE